MFGTKGEFFRDTPQRIQKNGGLVENLDHKLGPKPQSLGV